MAADLGLGAVDPQATGVLLSFDEAVKVETIPVVTGDWPLLADTLYDTFSGLLN